MSAAATFKGWFGRTLPRAVEATGAEHKPDSSVSFAELVWAHHERQNELHGSGPSYEEKEDDYRRHLAGFRSDHGEIVDAWWCRHEASAVVLTQNCLPRRASRFWRREFLMRLHAVTDWRTAKTPEISTALHQCETMAHRVSEVLRDSTERIALHWLFAMTSRLLAAVDAPANEVPDRKAIKKLITVHDAEMRQVAQYYHRAGENSARIVYFGGMVRGTLLLAVMIAIVIGVLFPLGALGKDSIEAQTLVCVVMGAIGAIVSVMTRMTSASSGFGIDFEIGRKPVRRLGSFRPFIGAILAFALFLTLKSNLLQVPEAVNGSIYFYATISFFAGFSERRAKVLLDSAAGSAGLDNLAATQARREPSAA